MFLSLPLSAAVFSLDEIFPFAIRSNPTAVFAYLVDGDAKATAVTWGDLGRDIISVTSYLKSQIEFQANEPLVIAILGPNDYSYAVYIATVILMGGAVRRIMLSIFYCYL